MDDREQDEPTLPRTTLTSLSAVDAPGADDAPRDDSAGEPELAETTEATRSTEAGGANPNLVVRSEVNRRENNEDSFSVFRLARRQDQPPITILAVADGMGGHAYGEEVSREALRKIGVILYELLAVAPSINRVERARTDSEQTGEALLAALHQTNAHVRRMTEANRWGKAGSTVVIAAITDDTFVAANLGDSPLFHFRSATGELEKVTSDHTVAGVLLDAGLISPEMARYHEGRSQLEFFLGASVVPRDAPLHERTLADGDLLLLCSDGVTGQLLHSDIANVLADRESTLDQKADRLLQAALDVGETDNQTLILWRHGTTPDEKISPPEPERAPVTLDRAASPEADEPPATAIEEQQEPGNAQADQSSAPTNGWNAVTSPVSTGAQRRPARSVIRVRFRAWVRRLHAAWEL